MHAAASKEARVGLVSYVLMLAIQTITVALLSLFVSVVLVIVLMAFFGLDVNTTFDMVRKEKEYLGLYAEKNILLRDADVIVLRWVTAMNQFISDWGGTVLMEVWSQSTGYVIAVVNTVNVFFLRLFVMIFSMPVYLVFGVIGLTRGLVGRELRKWGGGHESGSMFHLYLNMIKIAFVGSWIIYLSWPTSLNPNTVVLPFAVIFGATVMATAYRYKKYL